MKKILFGIFAICLLAVIGTASAAPVWETLSARSVNEDSIDGTIAYPDLKSKCTGGTTFTIDPLTHTYYTLAFSGNDLVINDMELDYNSATDGAKTVKVNCSDGTNVTQATFALTVTSVNDNPTIISTIPDQTKAEDSGSWTLDLTPYESDVEDSGTKLTWSVSGVDTTKFSAVVTDTLNDIITFTPVANAYGSDEITLTLTDSNGGTDTQTIIVTLTPVNNDPPTILGSIPDQKWNKGETHTLDLKSYLSDPDEPSTYTYTYQPTTLNDITVVSITDGIATFTPKVSTWKGTNTINFTLSDGTTSVTSNTVKLVVREKPDFVCEEGEIGDLTITSIEDPDSGDKFKPGEEIPIKVKVHNDDADEMDVVVKAYLYYESGDDIIENTESDSVTIDSDDTETIEFNLVVPSDQDVDEGNYVLYLKAYEDGNENDNCVEEDVDVDIDRDSHDVIISKLEILPLNPKVGDNIEITVSIENIGTTREDDVTVKITNTELGLNLVSDAFDLKKYDSSENDKVLHFTFKLPSNVTVGGYDIDAVAYNEDDDAFDASDDAEKLVSITLTAGASTTTTGTTTTTTTTGATTTTSKWTDVFGSFEGSKVFWIIGDIILVIVAIFFIKLIFSGRRRPVKEARL